MVLIGSLISVLPAYAGATCTLTAGDYAVDVTGTDVIIAKSGVNLTITGCSAVPVATVFDVLVEGTSGAETVTFEMEGGLFEEDSQVPFELALGTGTDKVVVSGTDEKDEVSFGDAGIKLGLNGPAQVEWATFADSGIESAEVDGQDGPDLLVANGSRSGNRWPVPIVLNGELGNDTLIGGDAADTLNGGDGHDRLDGAA